MNEAVGDVLAEASRHAAGKNAGAFLRLKKHLEPYLVRKYTTTRPRLDAAVPGPGCYIVHIIVVGHREVEETVEVVTTLDEMVDAVHTSPEEEAGRYTRPEWRRRYRAVRELGRRVLPCLRRAAKRHGVVARSPDDVRRLVDEHYAEILRCATRRLRSAGCRVEELGLIRRFRCTVTLPRRVKTVRHAVRLARAREKRYRTGTGHVVTVIVPARLRPIMEKAHVHIFRGVCAPGQESGTEGPGEEPEENP